MSEDTFVPFVKKAVSIEPTLKIRCPECGTDLFLPLTIDISGPVAEDESEGDPDA